MKRTKDDQDQSSIDNTDDSTSVLQKIQQAEKENLGLMQKIQQAKKERDLYESEYNKIIRSQEWHKTRPIREFINKITSRNAS